MGRLSKAKPHQLRNVSLSSLLSGRSTGAKTSFVGTKIVGTLGPSCADVPTLVRMLEAGMSVARIDLTWGPIAFHRRSLDNLQQAMRSSRKLCGVMVDTLGRELMIKRRFVLASDGWVGRALAHHGPGCCWAGCWLLGRWLLLGCLLDAGWAG
jgi:pyruvate kinase